MGLEQLSPDYQSQYNAAIPEIKRKAREAANARGMFYSGDSTDAETRAEEDLLAKLASESAGAVVSQSEAEKNRQQEQKLADQQAAATKRGQMLGVVGTGLGAAGTLAGLKYMMPKGPSNIFVDPKSGIPYQIDSAGKATPIVMPGAGDGAQVGGAAMAPGGGGANLFDPAAGHGPASSLITQDFGGAGAAGGTGAAIAAPQSMWQKAVANPGQALGSAAAGAGGGLVGNMLAHKIGGGGGLATDVGSGVGGLGGALAGYKYGGWMGAGLGALGGSLGGGLIGNLFK